jgi:hypothetical protein
VAGLEGRLQLLTQSLQQRRATIPSFVAQRLEAQGRQAVGAALSVDAQAAGSAADGPAPQSLAATNGQLADELQRCRTVSAHAAQATAMVMRALEQATDSTAQLASIHGTSGPACQTATDRVIAVDEKENASEAAAAVLRRRHEAKLHGPAASKRLC